jgi:prepilin peptidase CpaA
MESLTLAQMVFIVAVVALTGTAAFTDIYKRKIPNWLTLPFFAAGWIYQFAAHGLPGLQDGLLGFAVGFGTYFVLWMVAGGGGGDVKLMGAISVWLGFKLTLYVMVVSTLLVVIDSIVVTLYTVLRFGVKRFKKQYLSTGKTDSQGRPIFVTETEGQRRQRRILPFAVPLAMAAWLVMLADGTILKGGQL